LSCFYTIRHPLITLELGVAELETLHIHEEVIPSAKEALKKKIIQDAVFLDPIIVDRKTRVVLDGMHRVVASKEIGFRFIPVCYVDYMNPHLILRSWYRVFHLPLDFYMAQHALQKLDLSYARGAPEDAHLQVQDRKAIAALCWSSEALIVIGETKDIEATYGKIREIENILRHYSISYATERDAMERRTKDQYSPYLETPNLRKQEVIGIALEGRVFPQKTTRHVLPARPMDVRVSLEWLYEHRLEEELNQKLKEYLNARSIKEMPPGTFLDRRYEEPLYVFQS